MKAILIGDVGVGKQTLVKNATKCGFLRELEERYDFHLVDVKTGNNDVDWNKVKSEEVELVLVCISYDKPDSIDRIGSVWVPLVKQHLKNDPVIVLLLNKCDLKHSAKNVELGFDEVKVGQKARELKIKGLYECSATQFPDPIPECFIESDTSGMYVALNEAKKEAEVEMMMPQYA